MAQQLLIEELESVDEAIDECEDRLDFLQEKRKKRKSKTYSSKEEQEYNFRHEHRLELYSRKLELITQLTGK